MNSILKKQVSIVASALMAVIFVSTARADESGMQRSVAVENAGLSFNTFCGPNWKAGRKVDLGVTVENKTEKDLILVVMDAFEITVEGADGTSVKAITRGARDKTKFLPPVLVPHGKSVNVMKSMTIEGAQQGRVKLDFDDGTGAVNVWEADFPKGKNEARLKVVGRWSHQKLELFSPMDDVAKPWLKAGAKVWKIEGGKTNVELNPLDVVLRK